MPASAGVPPRADNAQPSRTAGQDAWAHLAGEALIEALHQETARGHQGLDYRTARDHMYGITGAGIDVRDGRIECIYTGATVAPDGTRMPGGELNTEHSWPQSDGAGRFPRKGDLHHLFPTRVEANSRRGSHEFGETTCTGNACPWADGGSELGTDAHGRTVFEVRPRFRGDVARAHFYFAVRYRLPIAAAEEAILRAWHDQDPPDARERERNDRVQAVQGNRNPFVDFPQLVDRIDDL